nr:hypothetical protein [Tanacetum cinerariifolium]
IEDQDFDALPSEEDTVSFLRELGHIGVISSLNDNRLDIGKCNGRIPRGLKLKEETFQVVLDALALTPCYPAFVITTDVPEVYMHQFWNSVYKHHDFYRFKIDKKKRFKLTLEVLYLPRLLENSKASPSKKDSVLVPTDEEPVQKGKRAKRSAKKSSTTLATALTKESQMKEVRKTSLRDFHKSQPSGSGSVPKNPASVEKIIPPVTNEVTGDKPGVPDVTKDDSTESESESWGNDDDDSNDEECSEQENESNEHELDFEQDTDGSESDSKSDQQDDDDEDKYDDEDDDNDDDQSKEEVSNFVPSVIKKMIQESLNQVNLAKAYSQPQSTYEAATTLTKFELKKILIDKMNSSKSYLTASEHQECYDGLVKSYNLDKDFFSSYDVYSLKRSRDDKDKDESPSAGSDRGLKKRKTSKDAEPTIKFKVGDTDTPQGQEGNQGPTFRLLKGTRSNYAELEYDFEECYKTLSEKLDWENPECGDYPFDLSKSHPLIMLGNRQSVPVEFFINNDLKYLQGGTLTMTYTTSTTKTKAAQYDLLGIEDMRDQRKSFYAYARGKKSRGDVYSIKCILAVTHVSVMRKHGYGYLKEIVNRLINLLGDDVADFAIALRMFTRSLVIQKRVEDLQLRVESYQKQINVTKPDTTRPDLRKRHPYTPYKNPQGFIYVDDYQRNRSMRSDGWHVNQASFFAQRHYKEYRHEVLDKEKIEHIREEKSSLHDQRHQQAS